MKMITDRNLTQELLYSYYEDRENGNDEETINYRSLIHLLTELMNRIEKLEKRLDKQDEYQQEQND
jgi:hypothetical protein